MYRSSTPIFNKALSSSNQTVRYSPGYIPLILTRQHAALLLYVLNKAEFMYGIKECLPNTDHWSFLIIISLKFPFIFSQMT